MLTMKNHKSPGLDNTAGSLSVKFVVAVAALTLLSAACVPIGLWVLSAGRPLYNIAVQETESQELLLNTSGNVTVIR